MPISVSEILPNDAIPEKANYTHMSIEALLAHIHTERLKTLKDQNAQELKELSARQFQIRELHDLIKAINQATSEKGDLDITDKPELIELLKKAKENGVNVKEDKRKFTKDERDRLVENVNLTVQDLIVLNERQMQKIQVLNHELFESLRLVTNTNKPLDEAKKLHARKTAGPAG